MGARWTVARSIADLMHGQVAAAGSPHHPKLAARRPRDGLPPKVQGRYSKGYWLRTRDCLELRAEAAATALRYSHSHSDLFSTS
jgi:hypothetical protein